MPVLLTGCNSTTQWNVMLIALGLGTILVLRLPRFRKTLDGLRRNSKVLLCYNVPQIRNHDVGDLAKSKVIIF